MLAVKSTITNGLLVGSLVSTCDNSGAKLVKITSFKRKKTSKGRVPTGGVGDMVTVSIKKGKPDMRKQVMFAVIVRQRKEDRRRDGMRIKIADKTVCVLQEHKGKPKRHKLKKK